MLSWFRVCEEYGKKGGIGEREMGQSLRIEIRTPKMRSMYLLSYCNDRSFRSIGFRREKWAGLDMISHRLWRGS